VNDDVNALAWFPSSTCELLVATEEDFLICDTRKHFEQTSFYDQKEKGFKKFKQI
jgi:hypothetical protein